MRSTVLSSLEQIKTILTSKGIKITRQRLVIYEALLKHCEHPGAEEVHELIRVEHPHISLATVYKNLEILTSKGLVRKMFTNQDSVRYDANMQPHSHLYCTKTNKIIDFKDEELEQLLKHFFEKRNIENFKIQHFNLQISGEKMLDEDKKLGITKVSP